MGSNRVPNIQSVSAILITKGNYILQLRDDKFTISSSGKWSCFGGKITDGESPSEAIKREIYEELTIKLRECRLLRFIDCYSYFEKEVVRMWFFASDVTEIWGSHKLQEGKDVRVFTFEQIIGLNMTPIIRQALECYHKNEG